MVAKRRRRGWVREFILLSQSNDQECSSLRRKQKSKMRSQKSSTGHKKTKTKGGKKERKKIKAYQRELEELKGT